jgi:hypothetical protein
MKFQLKTGMAILLFILFTRCSFAQTKATHMPWVSSKGYWVTESNIQQPNNHTIRFYTNENILVYTETLAGVKLNTNKRKIKMKLKEVLETAVWAWNKSKQAEVNKDYVAAKLK